MNGDRKKYPPYVGETTIKIIEFSKYFTRNVHEIIRSWGKNKYPVGGLIFEKNSVVWDEFREICERYDVNVSSGGLMFAVIWAVRDLKAIIPTADEINHNPFGLANDLNIMRTERMKKMDMTSWTEKSNELIKDMSEDIEDKVTSSHD